MTPHMSTFHRDNNFFQTRILFHTGHRLEMEIRNTCLPFLNSIRRVILEELPAYAITKVVINRYEGLLPEEVLAHRLGQIPIFLDPAVDVQFCMKLVRRGPGTVRTNDIEIFDSTHKRIQCFSELPGDIPNIERNRMFKPNVLITKQITGDILDINMFATRSNAKDHSKHSVVTVCFYKPMKEIKLTESFEGKDAVLLQRILTDRVIDIQEGKAVLINRMAELANILNVERGVEITNDSEECAVFVIETEYLDPLDVFLRGVALLMEKSKNLKEAIKKNIEE